MNRTAALLVLFVLLLGALMVLYMMQYRPRSIEPSRAEGACDLDEPPSAPTPARGDTMFENNPKTQNRLALARSPYLLQHADNPVDWYPWSEEAFEKAKSEDKPIFLSIGYSTCHWCHVMEHESFEDEEIARLLNETFVCIKVDREERPDIDNIYMLVCQIMTGGGGWPLTIIMTPDKEPFFAATYIPKDNRFGRMGMKTLIPRVKELWSTQRSEVLDSAERIIDALRRASSGQAGGSVNAKILDEAYRLLSNRYDRVNGGFGPAPKFPSPHNLLFLLRHWKRTGEGEALAMVEKTLDRMRMGGIYDHVGFGFHRYSTDDSWLLPHFEKMLYDQALLAMAFTEAYQVTRMENYRRVAEQIFTYVLRDMTSETGGFYTAEDADSEGEEGKFYLWHAEEIRTLLGKEDAELFMDVYQLDEGGNFTDEASGKKTGANILHLQQPLPEIAARLSIPEEALMRRLEAMRQALFSVREKRMHPLKDDKILTDWNGLMIASLSRASRVLGASHYLEGAKRTAEFILGHLVDGEGRLLHMYRNGKTAVQASVDDYAFFIWGLIELYEASFDTRYLRFALRFNEELVARFWDDEGGGFYFSPKDGETLLVRAKEIYDGAIPSGNSVAMMNLLRLGRMTANPELEKRAQDLLHGFSNMVNRNPLAHTFLMSGLDFASGPSCEVVIVGEEGREDTEALLRGLNEIYVPHAVVIFKSVGDDSGLSKLAGYAKNLSPQGGRATAYVCRNYSCDIPIADVGELKKKLR